MRVVIDRFEGDYAVCELEDGSMENISKILIGDAKEGDVININLDEEATKEQKEKITNLVNDLFK